MAKAKTWFKGKDRLHVVCCEELARAFEGGTDGEGYGALVGLSMDEDFRWAFNSSVNTPDFCPWCGAPNSIRLADSESTESALKELARLGQEFDNG